MRTIQCPGCDKALEVSEEFDLVVCPRCGQSVGLKRKSTSGAKPPAKDLFPEPRVPPSEGRLKRAKRKQIPMQTPPVTEAGEDGAMPGKAAKGELPSASSGKVKRAQDRTSGKGIPEANPVSQSLSHDFERLLPPKVARQIDLSVWLPPALRRESVRKALAGSVASAFDVQAAVEPEFEMEEKRVGYVEFHGEKIAYTIPNPRARWRYRVAFNLVAMLICLIVLYLAFLLIAGR